MEILKYLPEKIKNILQLEVDDFNKLEEIRLRCGQPIVLKLIDGDKIIKYLVNTEDILSVVQNFCENSIYSYQNQIANGFITINGGHRVGISGSCVIEDGRVKNINYIYSLNIRVAKQVIGACNKIIKDIVNFEENSIYNTLIVALPGAGKTTILRDLIRTLSGGIKEMKFKAVNVSVVDERGEIAALYKGKPQNDLGVKVDILENVSKAIGINMLVRAMSPKIIVVDEIGNVEDIKAINYAMCSGTKGIFSAHGNTLEDLYLNPIIKELINLNIIERIIFLDDKRKGNFKHIYYLDKKNGEYIKGEKII